MNLKTKTKVHNNGFFKFCGGESEI